MHFVWKLVFFVYNLVLIAIGSAITMLALGYHDCFTDFVVLTNYSDQNRMAALTICIALIVIALLMIILACFKRQKKVITVKTEAGHKITISVKAAQTMVLQALLGVPGIREVTPEIYSSARGITVRLHVTVEARQNVPALCKEMQQRVKDHLTNVSGLNVLDVTLLVENVVPAGKKREAAKKENEAAEPKKPLFSGKKKAEAKEKTEPAEAEVKNEETAEPIAAPAAVEPTANENETK